LILPQEDKLGKGDKRRPGKGYEANFEKIWGKKKAVTSVKRFDGRPRESKSGIHIIEDIKPFKSPITGEIISSRSQLRQHHKEHGTTDSRDYSGSYFERKAQQREKAINGRTEADRRHRVDIMRELLN
jgi:hypothetical protein